jgi:hypothetical protein
LIKFWMKRNAVDLTDAKGRPAVHLGSGFSLELGARKSKAASVLPASTISKPWNSHGQAMDEHFPDLTEETLLQVLKRRYADLAAWLVRLNRLPEPSRLPEPTRSESEPRINAPARQPHPPRPE